MKKILALALAMCMLTSLSLSLAEDSTGLQDARSYINLMYKSKPANTPKDYQLVGSVPGDDAPYTVEWTTDSDSIQVVRRGVVRRAKLYYLRKRVGKSAKVKEKL